MIWWPVGFAIGAVLPVIAYLLLCELLDWRDARRRRRYEIEEAQAWRLIEDRYKRV